MRRNKRTNRYTRLNRHYVNMGNLHSLVNSAFPFIGLPGQTEPDLQSSNSKTTRNNCDEDNSRQNASTVRLNGSNAIGEPLVLRTALHAAIVPVFQPRLRIRRNRELRIAGTDRWPRFLCVEGTRCPAA